MYKLSRRRNLIPFVALMGLGLAACMLIPQRFAENIFEVPAFALFPAEIALVMMLSVLFFENATPAELLRLSFTMLALCMFAGGMGNIFGKTSQTLPDQTLLLNWVQLLCMNVTGLIATLAFYQTKAPEFTVKTNAIRETGPRPVETDDEEDQEEGEEEDKLPDPATGESVQEILAKLDISRINRLEKSLKKPDSPEGPVSLESLFADENSGVSHKAIKDGSQAAQESAAQVSVDALEDLFSDENMAAGAGSLQSGAQPVDEAASSFASASIAEVSESAPQAEVKEESLAEIKARIAEMAAQEAAPADNAVAKDSSAAADTSATKNTLFDDASLGGDLEDIFADLAQGNANDDVTPEKLAEIKAQVTEVEPAPVAESKPDNKLMDVSDNDIDDIFANIVTEEAPATPADNGTGSAPALPQASDPPAEPAPAADAQPAAAPREVKEFGRLSAVATSKSEPVAPGTLKTIGQMLLDTQAVSNIIKRSEGQTDDQKQSATTARVVSVARGADIQTMLDQISDFPGIEGSLVIGKDGLLIGSTQSLGMMRDVYGVLALGMHSTTNLGTKKVDLGELKQSVLRCGEKITVMTEIGIGVLASFSEKWDAGQIDKFIEHLGNVLASSQASGGAALPMETLNEGLLAAGSAPAAAAAPAPAPAPAPEPAPVIEEPVGGGDEVLPITEMKGGLLNVDDNDIGGLFENVLADPSVQNDAIAGGKPADSADSTNSAAKAASTSEASGAADPGAKPALAPVSDEDVASLFDDLMEKADSDLSAELAGDLSLDFSPAAAETAPGGPPSGEAAPAGDAFSAESVGTAGSASESAPAATNEAPPSDIAPPPAAPAATPKKAAPAAAPTNQIKEFGRLSSSTNAAQADSQGAIKAIGRQLMDVQAVENIIKSGEKRERMGSGLTTARVISAARGEGIKALLTKIDGHPGVAGSLIVGNDGLVIASTLKGGLDKDLLGALCCAMHSHTDLAGKKLQMGKLRQIIFHAEDKITVLTAVAVGVLAVFVERNELNEIDSLLAAIEGTVRG